MTTAAELTLTDEISPLEEIAALKGWKLERRDGTEFILGMQARDDSWFWLYCRCDRYPAMPPAWHWYHPEIGELDRPQDTPKGGGFFHNKGVICAPWNRLAYKTGTSYGHRDAWALGFDGRHAIGVWMGRPDGTPVPGAFGADTAAPVPFEAFQRWKPSLDPLPPQQQGLDPVSFSMSGFNAARAEIPRRTCAVSPAGRYSRAG